MPPKDGDKEKGIVIPKNQTPMPRLLGKKTIMDDAPNQEDTTPLEDIYLSGAHRPWNK